MSVFIRSDGDRPPVAILFAHCSVKKGRTMKPYKKSAQRRRRKSNMAVPTFAAKTVDAWRERARRWRNFPTLTTPGAQNVHQELRRAAQRKR